MYKIRQDQMEVVDEAVKRKKAGINVPLGGGKTVISLAIIQKLEGVSLVVVSKTLLGNWINECKKFYPDLKYEILHSDHIKSIKEWSIKSSTKFIITTPEVVASSYKELDINNYLIEKVSEGFGPSINYYNYPGKPYANIKKGTKFLHSFYFGALFVDEIQKHNNITINKCCGLVAICADHRYGLSGTMFDEPIPSRILGWMSILHLYDPCLHRNSLPEITNMLKNESFQGLERHCIIRKKMDEVKLPEYTEYIIVHSLTEEEILIYSVMKDIMNIMNKKAKEYRDKRNVTQSRKFSSYLLALITYLRQSLISPILPFASTAIDISHTCMEQKNTMASSFRESVIQHNLEEYLNEPKNIYSSRIKKLLEILKTESNEKVIVFSTFASCLNIVQHCISETFPNRPVLRITSNLTSKKREEVIASSNLPENKNAIMLLTYELGAEGLNLQMYTRIVILDYWWNDCKTKQAIKRVYRQGQKHDVVSYLLTSGTGIENAIFEKQSIKKEIADDYKYGCSTKKVKTITTKQILGFVNDDINQQILTKISKF